MERRLWEPDKTYHPGTDMTCGNCRFSVRHQNLNTTHVYTRCKATVTELNATDVVITSKCSGDQLVVVDPDRIIVRRDKV